MSWPPARWWDCSRGKPYVRTRGSTDVTAAWSPSKALGVHSRIRAQVDVRKAEVEFAGLLGPLVPALKLPCDRATMRGQCGAVQVVEHAPQAVVHPGGIGPVASNLLDGEDEIGLKVGGGYQDGQPSIAGRP